MLLIIHNLPIHCKYSDIKSMIQTKCGLTEVILDNLVNEGQTKKVTVGLADEGDGAILVRKINGIYVDGQQLYVEDVRQKKESEQPYRSSKNLLIAPSNSYTKSNYDAYSQSGYSRESVQQNQGLLQDTTMAYQNPDPMNMMMNMAAISGMYYMPNMPQAQNSYLGYGGQQQIAPLIPQVPEIQAQVDRPFGFGAEENTYHDRQRHSYGDRRAPSPAHGGRDDRRSSRWDETPGEGRNDMRRSRSPRRGQWDRSDNQDQYGDYQGDLVTRDLNLQNYNQPQQDMYSDNYLNRGGSNTLLETPSNVLGVHVTQPLDSYVQDQPYNQYNQPDANLRGRNDFAEPDYQNPRGGRNLAPRDSKPYEPRGSRGGPGPSRQSGNRRDESNHPPKRSNKGWDNDQPQAKRFAPAENTPRGKNWKESGPQKPAQHFSGPKGSSNAPNRPAYPNTRPKGPSNVPNRSTHPISGPRGPAPNPKKLGLGFSKTNDPEPLEKLLHRDETWRGQSASSLAKDLLKDLQIYLSPSDKIFTHLKHSIRARINMMLGDQISTRPEAMVEKYRQKFPSSGNQEFFSTVVNDLKEQETVEAKQPRVEETGTVKPKPAGQVVAGGPRPAVAAAAKKPAANPAPRPARQPGQDNRLPKFPVGDKKTHKRIKAEEKKEWHEDNYQLPEVEQKVLDEEMDILSDIFMTECMNPELEEEKPVCEQIGDIVSDEFRKVVRIHVTKRMLNVTKNLIVRVFSAIRSPQRVAVEQFLSKRGCVALHKSDRHGKMYMAHFNSYASYDKIIAMGSAEIDGLPVSFKAFQLCGPPPSASVIRQQHMERRNKFIRSQIDMSGENILKPGYVYDPQTEKGSTNTARNRQNDGNTGTVESQDDDVEPIEDAENGDEEIVNTDEEEAEENYEEIVYLGDAEDIPDDNVDDDDLEDY